MVLQSKWENVLHDQNRHKEHQWNPNCDDYELFDDLLFGSAQSNSQSCYMWLLLLDKIHLVHHELNFENSDEQLFSIIKNYQLYEILNKNLLKNKYFKKIKSKKKLIKKEKYNLIVNTEYNNVFTKKYFSKKIEKSYNSYAYTTVINHEKISNQIAVQVFTKIGPLAFLPLSKNKTSIVYSIYNSKDIDRKKIIHLINQNNIKYKIKKIEKIENFELKSFNLRSYYHNNILAFGDLLHRIHPLAGQGFNMTIRDVNLFINIIKNKIDLGLPIDSSVNYEFEKNFQNVPFLKELFGKNVEESLIAADFKVSKNGNKTDFIFNPLSVLTPGKTRNFFDIWE